MFVVHQVTIAMKYNLLVTLIAAQAELQESVNAIAELLLKFEHTGASKPGSFLCHAMSELGGQFKEVSVNILNSVILSPLFS